MNRLLKQTDFKSPEYHLFLVQNQFEQNCKKIDEYMKKARKCIYSEKKVYYEAVSEIRAENKTLGFYLMLLERKVKEPERHRTLTHQPLKWTNLSQVSQWFVVKTGKFMEL